MLRAPTPAPAIVFAAVPSSNNKLFKQFIKVYLEAQVLDQTEVDPESCKQLLKALFSDFYHGNLQINYYQFCQQYEDHFEIVSAKGPNRISFAALFLRR